MSDENCETNEAEHANVCEVEKEMTGDEIAAMPLENEHVEKVPAPEPNMVMAKEVGIDSENKDRFDDTVDENKVILCNDEVCEGDLAVDMLQAANKKVDIAEQKIAKLIKLMLLADPAVERIVGGRIQALQWDAFIKAFPDEGGK